MSQTEFTPTEAAMLQILSDGKPHRREELHSCCGPSSIGVVGVTVCSIRKKLRGRGEDVVCVNRGDRNGFAYQHVRLLVSPYGPDS